MLRSIRWTLQLWHAAILGLALASLGAALYLGVRRAELKRVDAELESAANVIARGPRVEHDDESVPLRLRERARTRATQPATQPRSREREHEESEEHERRRPAWWADLSQDALKRLGQDERDQPYFVIFTPDGTSVRASSTTPPGVPSLGPAASAPSTSVRQRGEFREVIVPGFAGVRVLVGKSLSRELASLSHLLWTLLASGAGVMLVGLVGGHLLAGRVLRPIRTISQAAGAISESDLSRRIDVADTQSELGSLAHTLNLTFARLEAAFARQSQFTADASHELRTPLSVIQSHAQLALGRERSASEYRQTLETCLRAARRMKGLVDSLLTLARVDADRLDLRCESFNPAEAAEECVAMVLPQAQERNVSIQLNCQPLTLDADRTRITQLLTNLLSNAIRYNRDGGKVSLSIDRQSDSARITVADTGVGIPTQDHPRVFQRFYRADKARSREAGGSGLGLAICHAIVIAHAGTITFQSTPGQGTTFVVTLPLTRRSA